jgi:hypothetical protein
MAKSFFDSVNKLFDGLYKKNKSLAAILFYLLVIFLLKLIFFNGKSLIETISLSKSTSVANSIKIEDLEYRANKYEDIYKNLVTRKSFNDYILRKDKEDLVQSKFNTEISSKVSYIEGYIHFMSEENKGNENRE